ncbi:MAG: hypothetical protein Q9161_000379 [Pseudevernia consocians]
MTFQQEAASWIFPSQLSASPIPSIGANAPSTSKLQLPNSDETPTIITFLRHCGCPFAEKTFLSLRAAASAHPSITFVAVSHSDQSATDKWFEAVGGADNVRIIVDSERELFAHWGLGVSSFWHVLNPASMWNAYKLGKEQGIWTRSTESGNRWQTSGSFAVDRNGMVRWGGAAGRADWIPDFEEAVKAVKG